MLIKINKNINYKGFVPILPIIIIGIIVIAVIGIILILLFRSPSPPTPVKLTMWGVWDNQTDLDGIIRAYTSQHPYVSITYKKYRYGEYEEALLNAWARNQGPDIYAIPSSWITKYKDDFITPMPKTTTMAYYRLVKTLGIREEIKFEYKTQNTISLNYLKSNFVDIVSNDVINDNAIYGLPLSMDTLVLFYNKDLLNLAHIPQPPTTWQQFIDNVTRLTILDAEGNIIQSGASLGTASNIPRATDILSLIMLQYGTKMTTGKTVTFDSPSPSAPDKVPGLEALNFYTYFANPIKEVYSWNAKMPDALDSFANGKTAFFFGYQYQIPTIESKSQRLNYDIAPFPQLSPQNEINYANYWVLSTSQASSYKNEAWDFIQFATKPENVINYLNTTEKASALRSIINEQIKDPYTDLYIFANQALTAKNWYQGKNPQLVEEYFNKMITNVVEDKATSIEALKLAAKRIQSIIE